MFEGAPLLSEAERLNKAFRVREEGGKGRESRHFGPMPRAFNERSLRRLKKRGEVEISPSHAINVGGRFLNSPTKITLSLSLSLSKEVERVKNAKLKYQSISSLPRLLAQYWNIPESPLMLLD